MTTEADLLANLPADGVRVWRHCTSGQPWYRASLSPSGEFWYSLDLCPWIKSEGILYAKELADSEIWTEITPAPSLRDQRIAEAWERWPEGRLFEGEGYGHLELRMCIDNQAKFAARGIHDWQDEIGNLSSAYEGWEHWHEIHRPAALPTLPDPNGDLPDGTRVRVTYEGTVSEWGTKYGSVKSAGGRLHAAESIHLANAIIEVLSLPTPKPSALQGELGSLWRDPETGSVYTPRRIEGDTVDSMVKITGREDNLDFLYANEDAARIATFIPAEVAS